MRRSGVIQAPSSFLGAALRLLVKLKYMYRGFESPRYSHPGVSSFRGPGGSLRRVLLILPGAARSLCFSSPFLELITSSQKQVTASSFLPPERSAAISAAGTRTGRMAAISSARCALNAEHSSSVCCAESGSTPQWWHAAVHSAAIRFRYSPKQPCPVSIWVVR